MDDPILWEDSIVAGGESASLDQSFNPCDITTSASVETETSEDSDIVPSPQAKYIVF